MTEQRSFAEALRRYRVAADLTQEALAERARLSVRAISDIERGVRRLPYPTTVRLLAAALGLSDDERAVLETLAGQNEQAKGRINAQVSASGTLGKPTGQA